MFEGVGSNGILGTRKCKCGAIITLYDYESLDAYIARGRKCLECYEKNPWCENGCGEIIMERRCYDAEGER